MANFGQSANNSGIVLYVKCVLSAILFDTKKTILVIRKRIVGSERTHVVFCNQSPESIKKRVLFVFIITRRCALMIDIE